MTPLRRASLTLVLLAATAPSALAQRLAPGAVVARASVPALSAATAPRSSGTGQSVARSIAGGLVGGAIGAVVVGYSAGILNASRDECSGSPDSCTGYLVNGLVIGGMAGHALGIPAGAWLANGRRGNLVTSMLVSGGIFAAELLAVSSLVDGSRVNDRSALFTVMAAAPLAQLASSAIIEARTR